MLDNDQLCVGASLVYGDPAIYVPQQVSYLSASDSQESPMNKHMAMASLALEAHLELSDSLPSGNRSSRRLREFIPEHKKDDDYWMKRQKNNEAAKRSREKRRFNDVVMSKRIMELTNENKRLRMELDAIRHAYGTPPPRQPLPQLLPPRPSVGMPCDADGYRIVGDSKQRRSSLPSPGDVAVSTCNPATSLSCSSFACMPVERSRHMPPSLPDLQSFGRALLGGGLDMPLSFDEHEGLIRRSPGPNRSTCVLYPFEGERLQQKQMESVIPVGYGNERPGRLSSAIPTSLTLSSKVVLSPLDHLTSGPAGDQVNSSMPLLARHVNCLRTTTSESRLDTAMRQGNSISERGILHSQASRGHRVEFPLLFSDVSSSDESDDDILRDLYQLRSLEDRPLNLSTRSGSSPVRNGQALAMSCRNTGFFSEYLGNPAINFTTMPILENEMTSAFNLPASFLRRNYNRNVLDSLSKVELQSPEVPRLSSSGFLLPSNDKVPEKKEGLPEMLTREIISTSSFADSLLEGGDSSLLKLTPQNMDASVRAFCDEEETRSVGEHVISDAELYTLLRADLAESPTKAVKDTGQGLSRPARGGVPLKLWHKWSSAFSEEIKVMMEGREHDTDGPIDHFQE